MSDVSNIIDSGNYVMGEYLDAFERNFAKFCETDYCVGVNSGTDALKFSLLALGVTSGEVLTVSFTFPATIMAILAVGATPVFVDIDDHGLMCSDDLKKKINPATKAIIPVHFMGHPCKMADILNIAEEQKIPVIEDACQAVGALYRQAFAGSLGTTGCFSFFPTKNLSCCGDGGAVVTKNFRLAEKIRNLRNFGRTNREFFSEFGLNSRLDEIQAAILLRKLPLLGEWLEKRRTIAKVYDDAFKELGDPVKPYANTVSSYHLYPLRVEDNKTFVKAARKEGLDCRIHYSLPSHMQPFAMKYTCELPKTESLSKSVVSIPIYESIDVGMVLKKMKEVMRNAS